MRHMTIRQGVTSSKTSLPQYQASMKDVINEDKAFSKEINARRQHVIQGYHYKAIFKNIIAIRHHVIEGHNCHTTTRH